MTWRRALLLGLAVPTALLLQTTVLGSLTLGGTQPELVLLVVVAIAMADGPAAGAVAGFAGGFATDLLLDLPDGLSAFVFTAVGYTAGALREHYAGTTAWLPIAVAGIATGVGVLAYGTIAVLFGDATVAVLDLTRHAGLAAAYGMLLSPFVVPLVRRLSERVEPRKVVRL